MLIHLKECGCTFCRLLKISAVRERKTGSHFEYALQETGTPLVCKENDCSTTAGRQTFKVNSEGNDRVVYTERPASKNPGKVVVRL